MTDTEKIRREGELSDLEALALEYCCDLFNDFEENEVRLLPGTIQAAWKHGRKIKEF